MGKIKIHYQLIESATGGNPTIHEAYTRDGILIMINPDPIIVIGETVAEDIELVSIVETDIERHKALAAEDAEQLFVNYLTYFDETSFVAVALDDYDDENYSLVWYEDTYDDNVIPIDEYMKRRSK